MVKVEGTLSDVRQGLRFNEPCCDAYVVVAGTLTSAPALYQISLDTDGSDLKPYVGKSVVIACEVRGYKDRVYFKSLHKGVLNEKS